MMALEHERRPVERLALEAQRPLHEHGFTDGEIESMALSFVSLEPAGDVSAFIDWIERIEVADGAG